MAKKKYTNWKENFKKENSKGLGDVVEQITKATGIKKVVEFIAGEDCGCDERKEKFNELLRWPIVKCPTEKQFNAMERYFSKLRTDMTGPQQKIMNETMNETFNLKWTHKKCCIASRVTDYARLYISYLDNKDKQDVIERYKSILKIENE